MNTKLLVGLMLVGSILSGSAAEKPKNGSGLPAGLEPKPSAEGFGGALVVENGFKKIFNGEDLSGWEGNPELWSVKDGAIVGQTSAEKPLKGNTFLIWKDGTTADFELRCSYRITPLNDKGFANSGIQYRSKVLDPDGWVVGGYQADFEAGSTYSGILYEERMTRGIMALRGEKVVWDQDCKKQVTGSVGNSEQIQAAIKKEDWNAYVVIAKGNHLQHFINGLMTVDVTDECESKAAKSGVLALQIHAGPPMKVEFKDLRIKQLAGVAADPLGELDGQWAVTATEMDGEKVPKSEIEGFSVKIKAGKYVLNRAGSEDEGSFTVNASKTPKQMDIRPETGEGSGETIPAIYELDGDALRICYTTDPGSGRPQGFSTASGSGQVLVTYKRK